MAKGSSGADFSVTIPLLKAWQDDDGTLHFEGVASSTALDRQQERMTPKAIAKMAQYAGIDLLPSHDAAPLDELGTVDECWADNEIFRVGGTLDSTNVKAMRLYNNLAKGRRYALSVGGRVLAAHWEPDEEVGRAVRYIDDVELDHVAVCRAGEAANPDTYLAMMAKAAEAMTAEEDVVRRLGQAVWEVCRVLWPFGKSVPEDKQGSGEEPESGAELEQPGQEQSVVERRVEGEEIAKQDVVTPAAEAADEQESERGIPQSLPGQEKRVITSRSDFWKGVL